LNINSDLSSGINAAWESFLCLFSQTYESASSTKKEKPTSARGVAGLSLDFKKCFFFFFPSFSQDLEVAIDIRSF
jgi:protein transport protein SEC61 subunit alpha